MGSSPTSGNHSGDKSLIGVQVLKTPQRQHKQNQQFKSSVQQMKFSRRDDIFKQKSAQTKMSLNFALQSLKKNQLLSTGQFKKLHKTQNLIKQNNKKQKTQIKPQRYEYRVNNINKSSQNNISIKNKKSQNIIKDISSASSTHINQGKQSKEGNQSKYGKQSKQSNFNIIDLNSEVKISNKKLPVDAQVISHLLNRKKTMNSQNSNRKYKNVLQPEDIQVMQDMEIKYQNGKSKNNDKKKYKYVKSQKFIPHQLAHHPNQQDIQQYSFDKQIKTIN